MKKFINGYLFSAMVCCFVIVLCENTAPKHCDFSLTEREKFIVFQ